MGACAAERAQRVPAARARSVSGSLLGFHQRAQLGELLAAELVALAAVDPVEQAAHELGQVERVERLRHVVDAADVEAACAVAELGPRREEDDRDPAGAIVLEQLLGHPPAVEAGHHHVEEDDVGLLVPREVEAGLAVRGLEHVHPLGLEVDAAEQTDRRLVVDHEHAKYRIVHRRPIPIHPTTHSLTVPTALRSEAAAAGSSKAKREPSPSREETQMRPPMAVTSPRAMK